MNVKNDLRIEISQYTDVNNPLSGMRVKDRIFGTFNQHSEDYFVISVDGGELEVSLTDWIVNFILPNNQLLTRFVVPNSKIDSFLNR